MVDIEVDATKWLQVSTYSSLARQFTQHAKDHLMNWLFKTKISIMLRSCKQYLIEPIIVFCGVTVNSGYFFWYFIGTWKPQTSFDLTRHTNYRINYVGILQLQYSTITSNSTHHCFCEIRASIYANFGWSSSVTVLYLIQHPVIELIVQKYQLCSVSRSSIWNSSFKM